jgi:hypothetical protein
MKVGKLNIHVGYLNKDKDRGRREYEIRIWNNGFSVRHKESILIAYRNWDKDERLPRYLTCKSVIER